jgi:hypothetical protein
MNMWCLIQCCVSGSAWIRIQFALLDPDPYLEYGSGSESLEIDKTLQINLASWHSAYQKGLCTFVGMFLDLLPTVSIFFM